MVRRLIFLLVLFAFFTQAGAQSPCQTFINQIATEKGGDEGTVTFDGGTLKLCSFEDTSPNLKKGTRIQLLNVQMIRDKTSWKLCHIKVKVIDDLGSGFMNDKVGYMYPASTSFSDYADYTSMHILMDDDLPPPVEEVIIPPPGDEDEVAPEAEPPLSSSTFLDQLSTESTGAKGTVTFDGGTLKSISFTDLEPSLDKGTAIELISPRMIQDNTSLKLHHVKVKVLEGPFKGHIGYMYPSSTSFSAFTDYSEKRIKISEARRDMPSASVSGADFIDRIKTEKTDATGIVTFDGGTVKMSSFDDSRVHLLYGSKIELLSRAMIKEEGGWGLYHIKVKILDDLEGGKHNGKVGYMYPASTSFAPYARYSEESMEAPKGFSPDKEKDKPTDTYNDDDDDDVVLEDTTPADGAYEIPNFTTEKTGISGSVNGGLGDAYSYTEGSDWSKEVYLKDGTKFDLLSKKVFKDAITKYYFVKVKVTLDPSKTYTGKVVWVNVDETDLAGRVDKTVLTIK